MGCCSTKGRRKGSLSIPKASILKKTNPSQQVQKELVNTKKKTLSFQMLSINSQEVNRRSLYTRQIISD
ncbi:unnamed protein product [Paramecium octaurelia]|uniref:Uncharacterized protein n=1 Tax=Paramecium octaurelia TaxID=43137 RepID=A0A8S1TID4_PAROT|nr:unnamed protein product [Paramecium octaurelia]CAD8150966.1 unnamed protein product [Paramecium octaurelia]